MCPSSAGVSPADSMSRHRRRALAAQSSAARVSMSQVTRMGACPCQESRVSRSRLISRYLAITPASSGTLARIPLAATGRHAQNDMRPRFPCSPLSREGVYGTDVRALRFGDSPGPAGRRIIGEAGVANIAVQPAAGSLAGTAAGGTAGTSRTIQPQITPCRPTRLLAVAGRPLKLLIPTPPCRAGAPDTDPGPGPGECCFDDLIDPRRRTLAQKR
jgi:hypothetical protein